MEQLIIGTAGHVDHGKTQLISALTGVDTDRLREEKERGISIDLGFAPFRMPGGRLAGIVDVPGHERFIHNMLAGASGMDLVMLVVDSSEGVMPQTREHLAILELLGVRKGIVVVTKIDLVEEEWRELVQDEIREELRGSFLEDAPSHAVSAYTGQGIEELKILIDEMTAVLEARDSAGPLRLPVDRSFVIAGFGTVVTGTLVRGTVRVGDTVEIIPPGLEARVRNVQVHDSDVAAATAGSRVALNLSGLERDRIIRGSVIGAPGFYKPAALIDVALELLPRAPRRVKNLDPVHFFLGTARTVARLVLLDQDELRPGEKGLVQCRLDRPLVAERGDPFVIRSYSPMTTIGGGKILDPGPSRHRRFRPEIIAHLEELKQDPTEGGDAAYLRSKLEERVIADLDLLSREVRIDREKTREVLEDMIKSGQVEKLGGAYIIKAALESYEKLILEELEKYHRHNPLSAGISKARLKGFLPAAFGQREYDVLLDNLENRSLIAAPGDLVRLLYFSPEPSPQDKKQLDALGALYLQSKLQPPSVRDAMEKAGANPGRKDEFYGYLQSQGVLVKVSEELFFHHREYTVALELLKSHFRENKTLTMAQYRDLSGGSRKFAQALLEHFDREKLTRRVDDYRIPLKLKMK